MELIKCKNGHTYDPSITPTCPECERMSGHTVPLQGNAPYVNDDIGKTMPLRGDTMPLAPQGSHWADQDDYKTAGAAADRYDPTMPLGYDKVQNDAMMQPLAGWIVCVEGPEKGRDYRLHEENNYIGRSSQMDVCIPGDPTISRENHAIIAYDNLDRTFYFAPAGGASIVRHNGKAVLSTVELKAGDRIQIGKCVFMFVPLCGENFQWTV